MDRWLALSLEIGGATRRFGPDERDAGDIPTAISFATQIPGGFGECQVVVPRPEWLRAEDAPLFASGRLYGPGNETVYEGRVLGTPRVGDTEVAISMEGWSSALTDNENFMAAYITSDLEAWEGPSRERVMNLLGTSSLIRVDGPEVSPDRTTRLPGLKLNNHGSANGGNRLRSEAWFDAGAGALIGAFYYDFQTSQATNTTHELLIGSADDDTATNTDSSSDLFGSDDDGYFTPTASYRYGRIVWRTTADILLENADRVVFMRKLTVYGNHGLERSGDDPGGLLASDIIAHAVGSGAPLIVIDPDLLDTPSVPIQELWMRGTVQEVLEEVTGFGGSQALANEWGVYEDRKLFWLPPDSYGRVWRVRRDEFAEPEDEGPDGRDACTGVVVSYLDNAGAELTVGPTGSGADYETDDLLDTSDSNPLVRQGQTRTIRRDIGVAVKRESAIAVGQMFLAELNRNQRSGRVVCSGDIRDSNGQPEEPWAMRAGDRIVIEDDEYGDYSELPVVQTSFDDSSWSVTADVGREPDDLSVAIANLPTLKPKRRHKKNKGGAAVGPGGGRGTGRT